MNFHKGGDLRYHLVTNRTFSEEQTTFLIACVIQGPSYIHARQVIHRDLNPENLIFDTKGYLRITDFGIARVAVEDGSLAGEMSGTPGYMAPEVMCKMDHSISADYYALGVIAYECMLGCRPYNGKNRKEIRSAILERQVKIHQDMIPSGWSTEAADFINECI